MGVFNIANVLGAKKGGGSDAYGVLVDQLSIKQNALEVDGKLSPGDYDMLLSDAKKLYANPGLTPGQRSNVAVKISEYQKAKSVTTLKDTNDIDRLNREVQDDYRKNAIVFANNPQVLMVANAEAQRQKLSQLADSIDSLEAAGDDATNHINEYTATLSEYQDLVSAQDDMKTYQPGSAPKSNLVAYLTTNSRGEVVNVEIGRVGNKNGFAQTSAVYGGLQVYGRINRKENGKNIFTIGNQTFSAPDAQLPGPDGTFQTSVLVPQSQQKGSQGGGFTSAVGSYTDLDMSQVRTQGAVVSGGWAEGEKGALYKRLPNGKYQKYVNATKEQLGISDDLLFRVPRIMESGINQNVQETIDAAGGITPPNTGTFGISGPGAPVGADRALPTSRYSLPNGPRLDAQPSLSPEPFTGGRARTPAPTSRAPQTAEPLATSTYDKAKSFVKNLFF